VDIIFDLDVLRTSVIGSLDTFKLSDVFDRIMEAVKVTNKYLQDAAPWTLKGDEHAGRRASITRSACEAIYVLAHFLAPVIPDAADRIYQQLGVQGTTLPSLSASFDNLPVGTQIVVADVLFPRLEAPPADLMGETKDDAAAGPASTPEEAAAQGLVVRGLKEGGAKKGDAALDAAIALLVDIKSRLPKAAGGDDKGKGKGGQKGGKSAKGGGKKGGKVRA